MNQLSNQQRATVVRALIEGNSIRSTVRMTGIAKNTVTKLLAELGPACAAFHNMHVRNLRVRRIQCDEIWQVVGAKQKNATPEQKALGWGDTWTWTGIDADSKLMVSWFVGQRDANDSVVVHAGSVLSPDHPSAADVGRIYGVFDGRR